MKLKLSLEQQMATDMWLLDAVLTGKDPLAGRGVGIFLRFVHRQIVLGNNGYPLTGVGKAHVKYSIADRKLHIFSDGKPLLDVRWGTLPAQTIRRRVELIIKQYLRKHLRRHKHTKPLDDATTPKARKPRTKKPRAKKAKVENTKITNGL